MEIRLDINPVITAAVIAFIFENFIGNIVATEGAKIVGDYILLSQVYRGRPIHVGKKWALPRILYTIFSIVGSVIIALGVASVQTSRRGEIVWARSLQNEGMFIEQNNLSSIEGILSFTEMKRNRHAILSKDRGICAIEHATAYIKDEGSGVNAKILRSGGKEMSRPIASDMIDKSDWLRHSVQTMLHRVGDGPESNCTEVTKAEESKLIEELTWEGDLGGIAATEKLYCFKKGKYTVVRRENGRVKEKYLHIGRGSDYFKTLITNKNIPLRYVFDFAENGLQSICEKMASNEKFVPRGNDTFWIDIFPNDGQPVKVLLDQSTSIKIFYLIPGIAALFILIVIYIVRNIKGHKILLSQGYWVNKLLIDHYEHLESCSNPKETRKIAIIDTSPTTQHLGVIREETPVRIDRNKKLL